MRIVARLAVVALGLLAAIRALGFLIDAGLRFGLPVEVWSLEGPMAHLAWRVAAGVRLYPAWRDYPHVCNVFGPCYFVLVGLSARWLRVDLEGLLQVGRALTLGSALVTTLIAAWMIGRRSGSWAALIGGLASLGSAPMIGFGLMVRPDTTAELLGFLGFVLAVARPIGARVAGGLVLTLAILTKQTAGIFLLAAAFALVASGRRRSGAILLGSVALGVASVVALVTFVWQPMFTVSMLSAARTHWSFAHGFDRIDRLARSAPDLIIIPGIGLVLWSWFRPRPADWISLAAVVAGASIVMAHTVGSDLNDFLSLRLIEGLAIGSIVRVVLDPKARPSPRLIASAIVAAASLVPGSLLAIREARAAGTEARFLQQPAGRRFLAELRRLERLAADPRVRILTNSGLLQLHQGARAEFADPRLFRLQVHAGLIDPDRVRRGLEQETYDYVITVDDLHDPRYPSFPFGLPMPLVPPARAHYKPLGVRAGLHLYVPRHRHSGLTGPSRRLGRPRSPISLGSGFASAEINLGKLTRGLVAF